MHRSRPRAARQGTGAGSPFGADPVICAGAPAPDELLPFDIIWAGVSEWGPRQSFVRSGKNEYTVELVLGGEGFLEINEEQHALAAGDAFLLHPDDYCRYYTGPSGRWRKVYVVLRPEGAAALFERLKLAKVWHIHLAGHAFRRSRALFHEIIASLRARRPGFLEHASALAYELLVIAAHATPVTSAVSSHPLPVQQAIRYAEAHLSEPLTVAALAAAAGCSRQHLTTLFARHLRRGVIEWVTSLRMRHARHLLETTNTRILAIADAAGYQDPLHFSRAFKRHVGVSPRQYRANVRKHGHAAVIKT
jgi:AraC-like DNA-binding protein